MTNWYEDLMASILVRSIGDYELNGLVGTVRAKRTGNVGLSLHEVDKCEMFSVASIILCHRQSEAEGEDASAFSKEQSLRYSIRGQFRPQHDKGEGPGRPFHRLWPHRAPRDSGDICIRPV